MDSGERYVIPESADEEWVRPQPVDEFVVDALFEETDYDENDLQPLSSYVDLDELVALFESDTDASELTFSVETYDVTVYHTGDVDIES